MVQVVAFDGGDFFDEVAVGDDAGDEERPAQGEGDAAENVPGEGMEEMDESQGQCYERYAGADVGQECPPIGQFGALHCQQACQRHVHYFFVSRFFHCNVIL